jgi:hypothetical protein
VEPHEYDELIRTLVRITAHQDLINQKQDLINQQQPLMNQRLELTLQAIREILQRGPGSLQYHLLKKGLNLLYSSWQFLQGMEALAGFPAEEGIETQSHGPMEG